MERKRRLSRNEDIQRVRQKGKSCSHPCVVLTVLEEPDFIEESKIGVIATKSVGGAVERNQAKRILREAVTPFLEAIRPNLQIVLIARKKILDCEMNAATLILKALLEKAGALVSEK